MQPRYSSPFWEEGYDAYNRGYSYRDNPYWQFGIYDQRYIDWVDGMDTAFNDQCFIMTPVEYFY